MSLQIRAAFFLAGTVFFLCQLQGRAADSATDNVYSRPAFSVHYPSGWKINSDSPAYQADRDFSLRSPGGGFCLFQIKDGPIDVKATANEVLEFQKSVVTPVGETQSFTHWGRFDGQGRQYHGMLYTLPTTVRLFVYSGNSYSFVMQQNFDKERTPDADASLALIERTFHFEDPAPAVRQAGTNGSSGEMDQAAAAVRMGRFGEARKLYCLLLSRMQLATGFEDRNWLPVLRQLAAVYKAEHKDQDQVAALKLADDIASGAVPKVYIGTVEMFPDESITIRKHISANGVQGDAFIHLAKEQPGHYETCSLVAGLVPGQTKLLPPWPGMKNQNADCHEIACGIDTNTSAMLLIQHSEYTFPSVLGLQKEKTDNSGFERLTLHAMMHALDLARKYPSRSPEFARAMLADACLLSIADRIKYGFYLQPRFGSEETYAAVSEALVAKRGLKLTPADEALFAAFPAVTKYIMDDMNKREGSAAAGPAKN